MYSAISILWVVLLILNAAKRFIEDSKVEGEQLLMVHPISGTSIATIIKIYK